LQNNLPHAPVYWIAVQEHFHDLVLATYGRGFWILDDVTPLQQMVPQEAGAHLFTPRDAYRFRFTTQPEGMLNDPTAGENPPYGASINYHLRAAAQGDVRVDIVDASGRTVRTFSAAGKQVGINRVWWDLRFTSTKQMRLRTSPEFAPDVTLNAEGWRPAPGERRIALLAAPGTYTVKLTVDGKEYTQPLKVLKDPHSSGAEADIQTQTKLMTSLAEQVNALVDAVNQIESLRAQIINLKSAVGSDESGTAIRAAADQLSGKLVEVEGALIQLKATGRGQDGVRWTPMLLSKIGYLAGGVESSDYAPTTQQVAVHDELKEQAATWRQRLKLVLEKDLPAFNGLLRQRNVPNVIANLR